MFCFCLFLFDVEDFALDRQMGIPSAELGEHFRRLEESSPPPWLSCLRGWNLWIKERLMSSFVYLCVFMSIYVYLCVFDIQTHSFLCTIYTRFCELEVMSQWRTGWAHTTNVQPATGCACSAPPNHWAHGEGFSVMPWLLVAVFQMSDVQHTLECSYVTPENPHTNQMREIP